MRIKGHRMMRKLSTSQNARTILEAADVHENAIQELRSHHAAELESERLRVAEVVERDKKMALDDATARFASEARKRPVGSCKKFNGAT